MTQPSFTLSAFGDEIDPDLQTQLDLLHAEQIRCLELRSAWGRNVLDLDAADLQRVVRLLRERAIRVSAIGSPIGKSTLDQPREYELARLDRAIAAAAACDTRLIRVFSFFVPPDSAAQHRDEVLARLRGWAERAAAAGVTLLHENERDIYGDTPRRCHDLLTAIGSPALRCAFDPANFVQVGAPPLAEAWPLLAEHVTHVHIKDAVFADGSVRPAGQGDGAIPELLLALAGRGYQGFLTLEPHLQSAGRLGGFSGADKMRAAIGALRDVLAALPTTVTIQ